MLAVTLLVVATFAFMEPPTIFHGEENTDTVYVLITSGTCESNGYVSISRVNDCEDALDSSGRAKFRRTYNRKIQSKKRTGGCVHSEKACNGRTCAYVVSESPSSDERAEAGAGYTYFCIVPTNSTPKKQITREGGFCASSKPLGTMGADECMMAAIADSDCAWTEFLTKNIWVDTNGQCGCGTNECTGQYRSESRTIYEGTVVESVDCQVSGKPDKSKCTLDCYYVDNIVTKRQGLGTWCDWDAYEEEGCEAGDGECEGYDDETEESTVALVSLPNKGLDLPLYGFAAVGFAAMVAGVYNTCVKGTEGALVTTGLEI